MRYFYKWWFQYWSGNLSHTQLPVIQLPRRGRKLHWVQKYIWPDRTRATWN